MNTLELPAHPFGDRPRKIRSLRVGHGIELQLEQLADPDDLLEASAREIRAQGLEDVFQAAYSGEVWAASQALGRAILEHAPPIVGRGERLLELGCGCSAVPGLLACRELGARVTATDASRPGLALVRANAERNGVRVHLGPLPDGPPAGELELWALDWELQQTWLPEPRRNFDVIVAGDTIYEERLQPLLCAAARAHARPGALFIVVSATRRPEASFPGHAIAAGLEPLVQEDVELDWDGNQATARFDYLRVPT